MNRGETRSRRPGVVTWLSGGVVILAGVHLAGFKAALDLPDLPFTVPQPYLAARNGLWGFGELATAVGLLFGLSWARLALRWGGFGLAVWYWADRLLLTRSEFSRLGLPLSAGFTLLALGLVFWSTGRPSVRRFFEETAS